MKKTKTENYFCQSNSGQSLAEVMFAVAIASIVLLGLTQATTTALKNSQFAKNQSLANQFAQKGMEQARQLRDQNPAVFWSKAAVGGKITETEVIINTPFTKETTYERITEEKMSLKIKISWKDSTGGSHLAELTSYLTKWEE